MCSATEGGLSNTVAAALTASPAAFGDHLGEVEIKRKPVRKPHAIQLAKDEWICRTQGESPQKSNVKAKVVENLT